MNKIQQVKKFLSRFSGAEEVFTSGACYWMAYILYERFKGEYMDAAIMYNAIENHFACRLGGNIWDVTGQLPRSTAWKPWAEFRDQSEWKRIKRDCIEF